MRGKNLKLAIAGALLMATGMAGAATSPATTTLNVSATWPPIAS